MKHIIILADGASDYPIKQLGEKTPLMMAKLPNIDALCAKSRCGLFASVPPDMPPGSEIANLAVLGYDVHEVYQGRGVLEAASMGVQIADDELAMRCNLISVDVEGRIKNHSAGHITTPESQELIAFLNQKLANKQFRFYPGVSYRHLFVIKNASDQIHCTPPHDVPGTPFREVMVRSNTHEGIRTADVLNEMILKSQALLPNHPVNKARVAAGKDPANSVWLWSPGYRPRMKTFMELYGKTGAVISAVDLIYGIGAYAGFEPIKVEGSTGLYDTNYEGKAQAAVDALKRVDLVYLHIEASDEAGHEGDVDLKIRTLEYLDQRVVKYIVEETGQMDEPVAIAILPDHATPCELRTHVHDPVPFMIYHPGMEPDMVMEYNEEAVKEGYYGLLQGNGFIKAFLQV
ncbi:MAG: cofactor-independent phosphoglycerate mutase [Bacteroidales bacterium]|nr:cofactor-independent phosphoglycerate mutase [Bacteroidales bacterium]MDZ4205436.1 cofactor-independent phosphoglycerate mutase [Bacteroidales bacterium]